MAMTVMNNGAAMMSLGELNKNISKAAKDLKKGFNHFSCGMNDA